MKRFREELAVIHPAARVVAVVVYLGLAACLQSSLVLGAPDARQWPLLLKVLFTVLVPLPLAILALLIGYVNGDAERRGMRRAMWTLLAVFIPNAIGIILYFILREPLLVHCCSCGTPAKASFAFCPGCGAALGKACPRCQRPVEPSWSNCTSCGAQLPTS